MKIKRWTESAIPDIPYSPAAILKRFRELLNDPGLPLATRHRIKLVAEWRKTQGLSLGPLVKYLEQEIGELGHE